MSTTTAKLSQEELIKAIETMSVLDLAELVKGLETRFGVTAAAPVAAAAPAAGSGAAAAAEEKTAFDVVLVSA
ncbi:MAG TPA: 50S ribosomal protein L10, partial [Nitrospiraceae bacterium]